MESRSTETLPEGRLHAEEFWHDRRMGLGELAVVAGTTVLALQVFRVLFPLAYDQGERTTFVRAGLITVAVFASPLLAPLFRRILGPRGSLAVAVGGLAVLRVVLQWLQGASWEVTVAATALAMIGLTLLLAALRRDSREGARRFARGLLLGLAVDTGLRGVFATWDYAWQPGSVPLGLSGALSGLTVAVLVWLLGRGLRVSREATLGRVLPVALAGPFLLLHLMFLQSPAFVASGGDVPLWAAVAVVLVGDALGLAALAALPGRTFAPWAGPLAAVALIGLTAVAVSLTGLTVVLAVLLAHPMAAWLLWRALEPGSGREAEVRAAWRHGVAMALGGLAMAGLLLMYQIHYESPLPVPNATLPPVAALLLGLAGVTRLRTGGTVDRRAAGWAVGVPLALLVVPAGLALMWPDVSDEARTTGRVRVVSYNVHEAVNVEGKLDPEGIARVIEAQRPDVVMLQEVGRGWALSGMIDLGEWLSRRLEMAYVWGPAADGQFGNAIFTRLPLDGWDRVTLPKGSGPMRRNALRATLDLGAGRTLNVIDTHLQHGDRTPNRLQQIPVLLEFWGGTPLTVIAGDMNAEPGSPEIRRFLDRELVSAQDAVGDPSLGTADSLDPDHRIDWIFGTPDLTFSGFAIPRTTASDHLPLVVTVALP